MLNNLPPMSPNKPAPRSTPNKFRRLKAFGPSQSGIAAVEFALIAPIMMVLLLGLLDYGIAAYHSMELESAARSGAQYAMLDSSDTTLIVTTVTNSTLLDTTKLTVSVTEFCECSDGSSVVCGSTCTVDSVRKYMQIDTNYAHTPLFIPGIMNLSGASTIRTQ